MTTSKAAWPARQIRQLLAIVFIAFMAGASGPCQTPEDTVNIIQDGIETIDRQPAAWEGTMKSVIDRLAKERSDALDDVRDLYSSAVGQTQNYTYCTADFFGRRVEQRLAALLHTIAPDQYPAVVLTPVVGNTNPSEKVEADKTVLVTYYGYDFHAFNDIKNFKGVIKYDDGTIADDHFGSVAVTSNYQISLQFQGYDFSKIQKERGPQVVLFWGSNEVYLDSPTAQSSLPLIMPSGPVAFTKYEDWTVQAHADSGWFSGYTTKFTEAYPISGPWIIDRSKGDEGHPGIEELLVLDNNQSKNTLRSHMYYPESDTQIRVKGEITGAAKLGPGAVFHRTYRIYLIRYE